MRRERDEAAVDEPVVEVVSVGLPDGERLFHPVTLVVTVSILLHSSTDVVIAHWLESGTARQSAEGAER